MKQTMITVIDDCTFIPFEDQVSWVQDGNAVKVTLVNGKTNTLIFDTNREACEYVKKTIED